MGPSILSESMVDMFDPDIPRCEHVKIGPDGPARMIQHVRQNG